MPQSYFVPKKEKYFFKYRIEEKNFGVIIVIKGSNV
jgi:hypothetical protein